MNSGHIIWPNKVLAIIFADPWIGFIFALIIVAASLVIIGGTYARRYLPITRALKVRLAATQVVADQATDAEAQQAFFDHWEPIETAMMSGGKHAAPLRHAWTQFSETIVDKRQNPLQATTRPEGYFLHLGDETRVLAWWANIFVALGLTCTFLGIIGALTQAVGAMSTGGGDMGKMQEALMSLLVITAAKFWTSVGGVLASIILRLFDRRWHQATDQKLVRLCDRIEYGTLFSPPQRVAAEQLRELQQQSVALTEFSHQLAASIGDAIGAQIQPVVAGLSGIQTSIDDFRAGSFDKIGEELGQAISQNAGKEMEALAGALGSMSIGLQGVNDRLEGASGAASEQIAGAAREFSAASEAMTHAFATLNDNIGSMADRLKAQTDDAEQRVAARVAEDRASYDAMADGQRAVMRAIGDEMRASSTAASEEMVRAVQTAVREAMGESSTAIRGALEGFSGATSGIQTAFDQMKTQIAELGSTLSGSANDAAARNADVLARAADALEASTLRAQGGMDTVLREAIGRASEESGRAISAAFARFGEQFEQASAGLVSTLATSVGRMEALGQAIERSTSAAGDHAGKLSEASREAQQLGATLGRAANDVSGAAAPIRDAATAIRESVGQSQELLRRAEEHGNRQREAMDEIAGSMEEVADTMEAANSAAAKAWDSYRTRFEGVDEALAKALDQIKAASSEHATALNTEVGKIDKAMAEAVTRFAGAVSDIKELAEALDDVRGRWQPAAAE